VRDFDHTVGAIIPPVFDAYARVFHPASRKEGDEVLPVRWTEVAEANGREMHPAAEWGSITGSWKFQHNLSQPGIWDYPPSTGDLPHELAARLVAILSEHTDDPNRGFFAVWEGRGHGSAIFLFKEDTPEEDKQRAKDAHDAAATALQGLLSDAAILKVPQRPMHLLSGPLSAIDEFYEGHAGSSSLCLRDPPSLWWPADQSWSVGTDIDLMTTYVGASRSAIEALLADKQLETLPVPDNQSVTWEADTINPQPAPPGG
jgi:hypothetical protein